MYKPKLQNLDAGRDIILRFNGYENNLVIEESAFYRQKNMGSSSYPALSPRNKRAFFNVSGESLQCLCAKTKICYINDGILYYGGEAVSGLSFPTIEKERSFVSLGAKLLIFPDKVYINTADLTDYGNLEATFESKATVSCSLCMADGDLYEGYQVSKTAPVNPGNGDLWLDTSGESHALKQYSESIASWIELSETYVRISCPGIGKGFKEYDGVSLSGFNAAGLDGAHIIRHKDDDFIVVTGIVDETVTITTGVTVRRSIPDMDFICENGNRIWGCSSDNNEIYASKLGDPTNFNVYTGISTDSYAVSLGTDGEFTGAVSYRGYILFFKENCVHKIYGQNPPYTVTTSYIRGVQKGSHRSLVCLNEGLYYKSPTGICSYEGGVPVCVSADLGEEYYTDAVAGALGDKYYICMSDKNDKRHLFVYDEARGLWNHEDNMDVREFATHNCNLYMLFRDDDVFRIALADGVNRYGSFTGDLRGYSEEPDFEWYAETGLWGLSLPENKYYSSVNLRIAGSKGATVEISYEINSSGKWEKQISRTFEKTGSLMVPFISPRCDHLRLRIKGTGDVKIYSIGRKTESGSELNV